MRTSYVTVVPFFVVGALVACGGSTSGANSVAGTVAGISFHPASEVASLPSESCTLESDGGLGVCSPITGKSVTLRFLNRTGTTCANEFTLYANSTELFLVMNNETGVVPGIYNVAAGVAGSTTMAAAATFGDTSPTCTNGIQTFGSTGTITLTEMSSTNVKGSYDIRFGTDGAFSGSFDAPVCGAPDANPAAPAAGTPVCVQ